jgi:F-type H+-transporting ATPase subunit epsilon
MADTLKVELVTPERRVLSCDAVTIALPGTQGELGILPGHLPLLTTLRPGTLTVTHSDAKVEVFSVSNGFAEIMPNRVTILTDSAEAADKIDIARARDALTRAEQAMATLVDAPSTDDPVAAQRAINAAEERVQAVARARARVETYETTQKSSGR